MSTSGKIIIVSLLIFVTAIPVIAQDIHQAAKTGDLRQLKNLLSKKPSLLSSVDNDRMTPLHHTVNSGNIDAAAHRGRERKKGTN